MKSIAYIFLAFSIVFAMYSCNEVQNKDTEKPMDDYVANNTLISQGKFDTMRTTWEQNFRSYMASDSLHYFDMDLRDLTAILNEHGVKKARFYMGMDAQMVGNQSRELPHLMLVGLDSNGQPNYGIIADYTRVCPPLCQ